MNETGIEWCDYTWNPIVGCSPISVGCENCYAERIARRFKMPWGMPVFMPGRLDMPARVKRPGRVFVCSMADIGHPLVTTAMRTEICAAMHAAPWHQYIVLTKRPVHIVSLATPWPASTWLGVTIERQDLMGRWEDLRAMGGARLLFVSVEPMLGPISFAGESNKPAWVIAGPETGPGARPAAPSWFDALSAESVCFFDKRRKAYGGAARRREWPRPPLGAWRRNLLGADLPAAGGV